MQKSFSTAIVFLGAFAASCGGRFCSTVPGNADPELVQDPVSIIEAILPANWIIEPIEGTSHPPLLVDGKGKAIRLFHKDQPHAPWYSGVYVYIMAREYSGTRNKDIVLTVDHPPAASLLLVTKNEKVYISQETHNAWPNMKEDLINGLISGSS